MRRRSRTTSTRTTSGEANDPGGAINRIGADEVVPFSDVVATTSVSPAMSERCRSMLG
jgi:hypothetical protein